MNGTVKKVTKKVSKVKSSQEKVVISENKKISDLKVEIESAKDRIREKILLLDKLETKNKQMEKEKHKLTEIKELIKNSNYKNSNVIDVLETCIVKTKKFDQLVSNTEEHINELRKQLDILQSTNVKLEEQLQKEQEKHQIVKDQNAQYNQLFEIYQKSVIKYVLNVENFLKGFNQHT
ncbi:hypothetical protein FQR65_LT06438 [Abscondita terminalis]|nr:hypothetical protein FQR65_LT06438 [Abscondita terminalis]